MKMLRYMMVGAVLLLGVTGMSAKRVQVPQVYMFGFVTSFSDSVVYLTAVQEVKGAWIDSKTKFLLGRDNYSYQLKEHFANQLQQPGRVCTIFFSTAKKDIEKKLEKLKKRYTSAPKTKKTKRNRPAAYEVRYLSAADFSFEPVDMSPQEE